MLTPTQYEMLNDANPAGRFTFNTHFNTLAVISKDMANELDKDDWRQGFVDAVIGEYKLTEGMAHKIMYAAAFMEWLSANIEEFNTFGAPLPIKGL